MRFRWKALIAGGPIAAAGVLAIATGGRLGGSVTPAAGATPETPPRLVRVQEIRDEGAASEQSYTGVIRARYETDLAFRVGGKVVSRNVEVGQRGRAGQLLYRLDPGDYELAGEGAEAGVIAAEAA